MISIVIYGVTNAELKNRAGLNGPDSGRTLRNVTGPKCEAY